MIPTARRAAVVGIAVVLTATGCDSGPDNHVTPSAFTRDMAESVFHETVAGVEKSGVTDFCARFARSDQTCDTLLKDALRRCLLPGNRPVVKRAVHLPAADGYGEAWQLKVHGRTLDGQDYRSEFLVVRTGDGTPKAELGIYWTGQGQGRDMNNPPQDTLVPRSACPK
ncbi:hypothetical protein ACFYY8_13260 [Streptosporangium sp. NPDC001559]|uniref:hypothetical protein n=1 Tax=Streptosporangium sp. NPDC001559 TaxID=3366187 RepID=UPI0036EBBCAF